MQYEIVLSDGSRYHVELSEVDNIRAAAVAQAGKSNFVDVVIHRKKKKSTITINVAHVVQMVAEDDE